MSDELDNIRSLAEEQAKRRQSKAATADPGEDALALSFIAERNGSIAYVAAWGKWREWNGTVWQEDNTLKVYDMVRAMCRAALGASLDASTVAGVERLSRTDRRVARTVDQWDVDYSIFITKEKSDGPH
jgi:phage/plasmid-associated DNA primase